VKLAFAVPKLRARFFWDQPYGFEEFAQLLAERRGSAVDVHQLRVLTAGFLAAVWSRLTSGGEVTAKTTCLSPAASLFAEAGLPRSRPR
jgi:hypothetical protein